MRTVPAKHRSSLPFSTRFFHAHRVRQKVSAMKTLSDIMFIVS
jgi:hypothetical protein